MPGSVHALSAALATAATAASMAVVMAVPAAAPGLPASPATLGTPATGSAPSARTVAADGSYRLATVRTRDGRAVPVRWEPCQAAVDVRAAVTALPVAARAGALADVREALRRLSRATGMRFVLVGTTTRVPTGPSWSDRLGDAELVVAWVDQQRSALRSSLLGHDPDATVLATGGYAYRTWSSRRGPVGVIGRGFVVLDVAHAAATVPGFGAGRTRGDLLLHELGHVVGLAHVKDPAQLMYPVIRTRSWSGWRPGDRAGLARLGRASGCIGAPDSLWSPV